MMEKSWTGDIPLSSVSSLSFKLVFYKGPLSSGSLQVRLGGLC